MTKKLLTEALERIAHFHYSGKETPHLIACEALANLAIQHEAEQAADRSQQEAAQEPVDLVMLEKLVYSWIMHHGRPKLIGDFERASHEVVDTLKRGNYLRTAPAPSESAARKPLAEERLIELADRFTPNTETGSLNYRLFARAIEADHGITDAAMAASGGESDAGREGK